MGISRFAARFDRAKRLTSYALLVEGLTLGLLVAYFIGAVFTDVLAIINIRSP